LQKLGDNIIIVITICLTSNATPVLLSFRFPERDRERAVTVRQRACPLFNCQLPSETQAFYSTKGNTIITPFALRTREALG
jgi:hypothetical protein